jgi:hypothetical protein
MSSGREENELNWTSLGDDSESDITAAQGDKAKEPWYSSVLRTALPVLASTYQQNQLTKLNISRMQQGLPPISASTYASQYMVPAAQVQVGPSEQAAKLLLYGGGALLAFLVFNSAMKHRRA